MKYGSVCVYVQNVEPTGHPKTTEATQDPVNSAKNRYANIPACESLQSIMPHRYSGKYPLISFEVLNGNSPYERWEGEGGRMVHGR